MARKVRQFDEWIQGSSAASDPARGEYNSKNAQVYENGTLGVRPGWRLRSQSANSFDPTVDTLTSATWYVGSGESPRLHISYYDISGAAMRSAEYIISSGVWSNDSAHAKGSNTDNLKPKRYPDSYKIQSEFDGIKMLTHDGGVYKAGVSTMGAGVYSIPATAEVQTDDSTTTFTVDDVSAFEEGDTIYIFEADGTSRFSKVIDTIDVPTKLITITVAGASIAVGDLVQTTNSINDDGFPRAVTIYRERAYYWGYSAAPGRVYYSEPADFSRVYLNSFFDVSYDPTTINVGTITSMFAVKNALLIGREDNRWLVLTGTSPENGTLRELGRDPVPDWNTAAVVDNAVYFLNPAAKGVTIATPSSVETKELSYLSPTAYPGSTEVRPDALFMPQKSVGNDVTGDLFLPGRTVGDDETIVAVERVNDVYNLSTWEHDSADGENLHFSTGWPNNMWAVIQDGAEFHVYSRNNTLNRPAKTTGDTHSYPLTSESGDAGGTSAVVRLGETVASEGKIIRPSKVVIDLDYWKGGDFDTPSLSIDATVSGTESTTPEDILTTQTVTTTGWADSSGDLPYKRRVAVALPNAQFGTRFFVQLSFDGIALDTVQVYYDEQDDPR